MSGFRPQSFALFDSSRRLLDWDAGFASEFAGATLRVGATAEEILNDSLRPSWMLDLSWEGAPMDFAIQEDGREHLTIHQVRTAGGGFLREAWVGEGAATGVTETALRTAALEMTRSTLARQNLETEELRRAQEVSEERLKLATRAANIGVWDWDIVNGELFWDENMYRLYGVSQETFHPAYAKWLQCVHPDDTQIADGAIQAALRGEKEYAPEFRILWPDGSVHFIQAMSQTLRDMKGKPLRMIGTNMDITERKKAEAELENHRHHLEELVATRTSELATANNELEAFAYTVSHDLRAPLRSIDGFSKILLVNFGSKLDQEGMKCLETIRNASLRMGQLIEDILQLSRINRSELHLSPLDLSKLAHEVAESLEKAESQRKVKFEIAPGCVALADRSLMRTVLENLIGNAWKFTGHEPAPQIQFGVKKADGETVYFVHDNGAGFEPQFAHKLFTPFQRLHSMADFPGTGIGLASVERIIHRHGGRAWIEGQPGEGATVYFTLGRG